jgi:hypothetical protein
MDPAKMENFMDGPLLKWVSYYQKENLLRNEEYLANCGGLGLYISFAESEMLVVLANVR